MATVQDIYKKALMLIDEVQDDGSLNPSDQEKVFETKTIQTIMLLMPDLLASDEEMIDLVSMDDVIPIENAKALSALAYGVAAQLMITENQSLAAFYNDTFLELKRESKKRSSEAKIIDKYGVLGGLT